VHTFILWFQTAAQGCCGNQTVAFFKGQKSNRKQVTGASHMCGKTTRNSKSSYFRWGSFIWGIKEKCGRGNTVQCDYRKRSLLSWEFASRSSILTRCHKWRNLSSAATPNRNPTREHFGWGCKTSKSYWEMLKLSLLKNINQVYTDSASKYQTRRWLLPM